MESLYNLVNKTTGTSKQSKIQIGYNINGFAGVLEALKEAQKQMVSENDNNPIFDRWTESSALNEKINAVVDGFVVDDKLNPETYRQQQCVVMPYMSFVISLVNESGETQLYYVPFTSNRTSLDCGNSVSSKNKFPIAQITKEYCESSGIILGSMSSPFEVGIGVDLSESGTAESFFERCYKEIYVRGMAKKLAEKGLLFAEIVFPTNSSTKIVNVKVTVDSGVSEQGKAHCIYFPFPLLLTNEYKDLCKVQVNSGSYTTIGDGGCTYPFNTAKYDYKKATLSGFTPQCVNDIIKKDGKVLEVKNPVLYQFNSVTKDFSSNACYIRFYLDSSKKEDIVKIIGKDIPDVYDKELYIGLGEAKVDVKPTSSTIGKVGEAAKGLKTDSAFYAPGQIDWVQFKKKHPKLPDGHDVIIEQIAKEFNINTRMWMTQMGLETGWFGSKNFRTRRNPGGISASNKYKGGEVYTLGYLGGVKARRAQEVRGEGYGHYWIFETFEDGYRAMAYLLVNSSRYGLAKKGAETVYQHFTNMYNGGYCDLREAVCQNYNDKLMNQYEKIPSLS